MNIAKNNYETTFILNASLEDGQIESTTNHVQEVITRNGGEIKALNKWGRKRLAYPIQKKNNGFYVNMEFIAPAPALALLERVYQLDENVLRFLTLHLDDKVLTARSQALAASVASAAAAAAAVPVPVAAPAAPVAPAAAAAPAAAPVEASPEKKEPLFKDDASTKSQKPA